MSIPQLPSRCIDFINHSTPRSAELMESRVNSSKACSFFSAANSPLAAARAKGVADKRVRRESAMIALPRNEVSRVPNLA